MTSEPTGLALEKDRVLGVRVDDQNIRISIERQCFGRPLEPVRILCYDVKNDIAVNQYFHQFPRVMAIICSVLIPTVALPRILETIILPRL